MSKRYVRNLILHSHAVYYLCSHIPYEMVFTVLLLVVLSMLKLKADWLLCTALTTKAHWSKTDQWMYIHTDWRTDGHKGSSNYVYRFAKFEFRWLGSGKPDVWISSWDLNIFWICKSVWNIGRSLHSRMQLLLNSILLCRPMLSRSYKIPTRWPCKIR